MSEAVIKPERDEPSGKRARKRRRRTNKELSSAVHEAAQHHVDESATRISTPLHGKVVAVSTLNKDGGNNNNGNDNNSLLCNYKSVQALCERLGATVSGQVHPRIFCVVASREAVAEQTQRVRKAYQKHIPVVSVQWLQDCQARRQLVPLTSEYRLLEQHQSSSLDASFSAEQHAEERPRDKNERKKRKMDRSDNTTSLVEKKLDLGCCCLCHDEDSALDSTACPWCVDCSVNRAAAAAAAAGQEETAAS